MSVYSRLLHPHHPPRTFFFPSPQPPMDTKRPLPEEERGVNDFCLLGTDCGHCFTSRTWRRDCHFCAFIRATWRTSRLQGKRQFLALHLLFFLRIWLLVQPRTGTRDLSLRKIARYLIIAVLHSKIGLEAVIHFWKKYYLWLAFVIYLILFYFMFSLLFFLSRKSHSLVFLGSIFSAIRETRGSLDGSVHW